MLRTRQNFFLAKAQKVMEINPGCFLPVLYNVASADFHCVRYPLN
jgi:hypothetical protein